LSSPVCPTKLRNEAMAGLTCSIPITTAPCSWTSSPQQYALTLWGYCLMSNHFHLVAVPAQEGAAAKVLGRLEADYARYLNVRRRTSCHLWQARYHSVAMEAPHCWRALAYVERNPVRAGMTAVATGYRWSSAAARMGKAMGKPGETGTTTPSSKIFQQTQSSLFAESV
jgi:REP element-mobilizing transposase RayT